jgi:hypothetical protein
MLPPVREQRIEWRRWAQLVCGALLFVVLVASIDSENSRGLVLATFSVAVLNLALGIYAFFERR